MRIILLLATLAGAAAISGPAPAEAAGATAVRGGGGHGARRPIVRGPAGDVLRHARPGAGRRLHRHHRRHGRFGPRDAGFIGYGVGGIGGGFEAVEPYGGGFFAAGGGRVSVAGGRPHYDYDRAYPYEWASAAGGREGWAGEEAGRPPPQRCGVEHGVRVCRGGR